MQQNSLSNGKRRPQSKQKSGCGAAIPRPGVMKYGPDGPTGIPATSRATNRPSLALFRNHTARRASIRSRAARGCLRESQSTATWTVVWDGIGLTALRTDNRAKAYKVEPVTGLGPGPVFRLHPPYGPSTCSSPARSPNVTASSLATCLVFKPLKALRLEDMRFSRPLM